MFLGSARIEGCVTISEVLLKKKCAYPNANWIIFGVESDKLQDPSSVKKLLLVLLTARIVGYNIEKNKTKEEDDIYGQILWSLAFATHPDGTKTYILALHYDRYWLTVSTL